MPHGLLASSSQCALAESLGCASTLELNLALLSKASYQKVAIRELPHNGYGKTVRVDIVGLLIDEAVKIDAKR